MKINENIPLTIYFELGRTKKSIKDLLNIEKETVYRLEKSKKDIVSIIIGKKKVGEGKILIHGGKMYVEIIRLIDENFTDEDWEVALNEKTESIGS